MCRGSTSPAKLPTPFVENLFACQTDKPAGKTQSQLQVQVAGDDTSECDYNGSDCDDSCSTDSTFSCLSPRSSVSSAAGSLSPTSVLRSGASVASWNTVELYNADVADDVGPADSESDADEINLPDDLDLYPRENSSGIAHSQLAAFANSNVSSDSILGRPAFPPAAVSTPAPYLAPSPAPLARVCGSAASPPNPQVQYQQHQQLMQQQMSLYWQQMYLNQMHLQQLMHLQQQQQQQQQQRQQQCAAPQQPQEESPRVFLPPRFLPQQNTAGTGVFLPPTRA
ncbi:unnamed protein product [Closterium sp. Naga37s-1]|nr:unnamed protein product [Closterium sp. Naga37s-1]